MESGRYAVDGANGEEVTGWVDPNDAMLIMAAPDLLEALQSAPLSLHVLPEGEVCRCSQCEFVRMARIAIAKALGEQE